MRSTTVTSASRDNFDATVEEVDLGSQAAADAIDTWVNDQTKGLIENIAADLGLPDPGAVLALVNAVYFLGEWTTQFNPSDTADAPFTKADGTTITVPMMHLHGQTFAATERPGYQMIRMPYGHDGRYGMEIFLPAQNNDIRHLLSSLDATEWHAAVNSLKNETFGSVALPRLELEWNGELAQPLEDLGMAEAFGAQADFSAMSPAAPQLAGMVHKTYIRIDEHGTEAAAVTGGLTRTSVQSVFHVDRPFIFTISDRDTGTIVFLGAVADPAGS